MSQDKKIATVNAAATTKVEAKPATEEVKDEAVEVMSLDEIKDKALKEGGSDAEKLERAFKMLSKVTTAGRSKGPNRPRPDRSYKINVKAQPSDAVNMPPQASQVRQVLEMAVEIHSKNVFTEAEIFRILERAGECDAVKTEQEGGPIRIFKYYRKNLEDFGFLEYTRRGGNIASAA